MDDYAILRVAHTGITVSDLPRTLRFFRTVLGFQTSFPVRVRGEQIERITGLRGAEADIAFARNENHVLEFLSFVSPAPARAPPLRPCDASFFHLCLKVKNIARAVDALQSGGFEAIGPIQTVAEGPARGMQMVYLRDADGICLELAEDAPGVTFEDLFFRHPYASTVSTARK